LSSAVNVHPLAFVHTGTLQKTMSKAIFRARNSHLSLHKRLLSTSAPEERILITGGQGFLGGWVIKQLLEEPTPPKVWSLDVKQDDGLLNQIFFHSLPTNNLERVYADVANTKVVEDLMMEVMPTSIIHLAGIQIPTCRVNPIFGANVNVIGTLNIFEAVRKLKQDKNHSVSCVTYASSAGVFGPPTDYKAPLEDKQYHEPRTHYGVFKTANEGNARVYWQDHGISSVGLRPLTVYGVGREIGLTSDPTKAIKSLVLGKKYNIGFTGSTAWNYIEDMADVFIRCARSNPSDAVALNIKGEVASIDQFIGALGEAFGKEKVAQLITRRGPHLPLAYEFQEKGLEELLGERPIKLTPLTQALPKIAAHFQKLEAANQLNHKDLEN